MYIPAAFHEQDLPTLRAVIRANPFALLVSQLDDVPFATHMPMLLETRGETDVLIGHVARANAHVRAFDGETDSMAVFSGPHAYVSPRWMTAPAVPTWNYVAVHCYGQARRVDDPARVRATLAALTDTYENGQWSVDDLDPAYVERMMNGLVAFEMPIDLWRGKVKMSQNKPEGDQARIARALREDGEDGAADWMAPRRPNP